MVGEGGVFRPLRDEEQDAGYRTIVESVAWQKSKGIDLWDRPLPRDVYARRQRLGWNFAYFLGVDVCAVVSLARGVPAYWSSDVPSHADRVWLCTLATATGFHARGIGGATVNAAIELLMRRGEDDVWLDCKPGFLEDFYGSLGFLRICQKTVETGRPELPCRCVEGVLMRRDLRRVA